MDEITEKITERIKQLSENIHKIGGNPALQSINDVYQKSIEKLENELHKIRQDKFDFIERL